MQQAQNYLAPPLSQQSGKVCRKKRRTKVYLLVVRSDPEVSVLWFDWPDKSKDLEEGTLTFEGRWQELDPEHFRRRRRRRYMIWYVSWAPEDVTAESAPTLGKVGADRSWKRDVENRGIRRSRRQVKKEFVRWQFFYFAYHCSVRVARVVGKLGWSGLGKRAFQLGRQKNFLREKNSSFAGPGPGGGPGKASKDCWKSFFSRIASFHSFQRKRTPFKKRIQIILATFGPRVGLQKWIRFFLMAFFIVERGFFGRKRLQVEKFIAQQSLLQQDIG